MILPINRIFKEKSGTFLSWIFLFCVLIISIDFHFSNLKWGLPSKERTLQVIGDSEKVNQLLPKMIEQRNKYYSMVEKMLDKTQPFEESYKQLAGRWDIPPFQLLPEDIVLDRMRHYLIGVNIADEQVVMSAISGLNPKKLDFVPGPLRHYGGIYYYTAGAFLMFGKICGWLTLNPGVEYYFGHPEETRWMYALVRAVGGVSILATVLILFLTMKRLYETKTALLTILFFAFSPILVPYSHLSKAHLFGMFWLTAGIYFCGLILKNSDFDKNNPENSDPRLFINFSLAGISIGFCAGTIVTNLPAAVLIVFTEWMRQEWNLGKTLKSKYLWTAIFGIVLIFGITNFYVFIYFEEFRRFFKAMVAFYPAYTSIQWHEWLPYLKEFCTEQFHWSFILLFIVGIILTLKRREKFTLLCLFTFLILFLQNLVTIRHAPVNVRFVPSMAILVGYAISQLLSSWSGWKKKMLIVYTLFSVLISGIQCHYYKILHKSPSNLDIAGEWINENVPAGSTIGAWGGGFTPFDFPPIHFLNYKMIHIPHLHQLDQTNIDPQLLPQYIVIYIEDSPKNNSAIQNNVTLTKEYQEINSWKQPMLLRIKFKGNLVETGNWKVSLLKKV